MTDTTPTPFSRERLHVLKSPGKTHVTDEGLSNLAGLTALERLNLEGTHVTQDGIERLKRALPNAEVHGP